MKQVFTYFFFAIMIFSLVSIACTGNGDQVVDENEVKFREDVVEIHEEYMENCSDCVGNKENVNEYNEENTNFAKDLSEDASDLGQGGPFTASTMITLFQSHKLTTPCPGVAARCPPN